LARNGYEIVNRAALRANCVDNREPDVIPAPAKVCAAAAGATVAASIADEAVDAVGLAVGKKASAAFKAFEVMAAVD
jgi:hypothetical protein